MGSIQAAVQQVVESPREQGSTFGALLVLGPDGVTPMHLSPDALLDILGREPLLLVSSPSVTS